MKGLMFQSPPVGRYVQTAEYLERRCGGKSGFAHSKTAHEKSISTGESEQKIPLLSAQYIMYDMPDHTFRTLFLGSSMDFRVAPFANPALAVDTLCPEVLESCPLWPLVTLV